jgi:HlyD family secretion protein
LKGTGASSTRQFDEARSQRDRDQSRLEELDAQIRIARMPGRDEEIRAAEAAVTAARASLAQAEWRLAQTSGTAPTGGIVVDTLYCPGEMVPAGLPVVQLLPPENIKIRFFVPEPDRSCRLRAMAADPRDGALHLASGRVHATADL